MGRVNPWVEEAFRRAEARRKEIRGIPAVVEVEPGRAGEVVLQLRRMGYRVEGVVDDFVFVDLPEPADFERVARLPHVVVVSAQKKLYPMAYGLDQVIKRIAVATDPILSALNPSDLGELGVVVRPASELPEPFDVMARAVEGALKERSNPLVALLEAASEVLGSNPRPPRLPPVPPLVFGPPHFLPPVATRAKWRLVTDTRVLMEAPSDNVIERTYVGVIDSGVYQNPAVGSPNTDWTCESLTLEPPVDTMGHGTWVHSCAFGRPCSTGYGRFVPVASAKRVYHVKVFTAFGPCTSFQVMKAMEMCATKGCRVVNMSLGGPLEGSVEDDPECSLLERLTKKYDTVFVAAAGNDGEEWSINSPAASPYAICVTAVDWETMKLSSYSSRGPQGRWYKNNRDAFIRHQVKYGVAMFSKPDVAGIGGDRNSQVVAACSLWYDGVNDLTPNGFEMMIGTSMATPHVAGLTALALDRGHVRNVYELKWLAGYKHDWVKDVRYEGWGYGILKWSDIAGKRELLYRLYYGWSF